MPKILIKEIDNTSLNNANSTNFSVVVPGFCRNTIYTTSSTLPESYPYLYKDSDGCIYNIISNTSKTLIFDENGVYECDSSSDFVSIIGCDETGKVARKFATLAKDDSGNVIDNVEFDSVDDFKPYWGQIYTGVNYEPSASEGKLIVEFTSTSASGEKIKTYKKYTLVDESEYTVGNSYSVILAGDEGNDLNTTIHHYGNQIAYELLKHGYTVLFKLLTDENEMTNYDTFWKCLEDKSLYDFRYVLTGSLNNNNYAEKAIIKLANLVKAADYVGRGDCIALVDVDEANYDDILTYCESLPTTEGGDIGKNAAIFAPYVEYSFTDSNYENRKFPGSLHYLLCSAKALRNYPEWFAVAGYNRGICDYTITGVGHRYGDADIQAYQARTINDTTGIRFSVNFISKIRGTYYIWGNRTAKVLDNESLKASHFLNIRQLCCSLEKRIYNTCKALTYDPNSDILWMNFCNAIRPILEEMKANQGIKDYAFEKKSTSLKAKLFAAVRIVPIEAVEDFEIGVSLEDNLDNPTVQIDEEIK